MMGKVYEYKAIRIAPESGVSLELLNEFGREGWVVCLGLLPDLIFVREIECDES